MNNSKAVGAGGGALAGASAGATIGSVVPGIGTVIGGAIGAIGGGLFGAFAGGGDTPQYQPPPPDPLYQQLRQQAENQQIAATQTQASGDMASLMARYGALASISGGAAPSFSTPSTMPVGMSLQLLGAGMPGSPLGQIARGALDKIAA